MLIKNIFNGLKKRLLETILIILQLTISLVVFIIVISMINSFTYTSESFYNNISYNTNNLIHLRINPDSNNIDKYNKLKSDLAKSENIDFIGTYIDNTIPIDNQEIKNKYSQIIDKYTKKNKTSFGANYDSINSIVIEKGLEQLINLDVIEGRSLVENDFYTFGNEIPILIGYDLYERGLWNVGDVILDTFNHINYNVIGVLDGNVTWPWSRSIEENNFIYLSDMIVAPLTPLMYEKTYFIPQLHFYCGVKNNKDINSVINFLNEFESENVLNIDASILNDEFLVIQKQKIHSNEIIFMFCIFFFIMTSIGIMFTLYKSIETRKYEFGVRLANGASCKELKKLVLIEVLVMFAFSIAISIIISIIAINSTSTSIVYNGVYNGMHVSLKSIVITIIISLIMSILPSIISIYKINSLSPIELIRRIR